MTSKAMGVVRKPTLRVGRRLRARRSARQLSAIGVACGLLTAGRAALAGTTNLFTGNDTATPLNVDDPLNWSQGSISSAGYDASIDATYGATSATALYQNASSVTFGSLNDTNANAINIRNLTTSAYSLTLGGGTNSVALAAGGDGADLLYVGANSNLTLSSLGGSNSSSTNTSFGAISLVLTTSGNFNIQGSATIGSIISGSGIVLTKTGAGTLTLGATSNSFSGGTIINSGTIDMQHTNDLGGGPITLNGGTLQYYFSGFVQTSSTFANAVSLNSSSSAIQVGTSAGSSSGNSFTCSGLFSGTGGLTKTGAGLLSLTNATSTYSGGTNISAGTLNFLHSEAIPSGSLFQIGNNATFEYNSPSGGATTSAAFNLSGTSTILLPIVTTSAQSLGISGKINGAGSLTKAGLGTLGLKSTTNAYSGGTIVTGGNLWGTVAGAFGTGDLTVNPTGTAGTTADAVNVISTGSLASTANVTVNTKSATAIGTLFFNTSSPVIGSLSGTGAVVLNVAAGTALTTGAASSTGFSGTISDNGTKTGSIIKLGTGTTFALTGSNTYGGGTTVTEGTLLANTAGATNSSTGSGPVTVATGAMLGGNGYIVNTTGPITINGTVTAGATNTSIGLLTTGAQAWNNSGSYLAKVTADGTATDQLSMSGLTVPNSGSAFTVTLSGLGGSASPTYLTATQVSSIVLATDTNASAGVFTNAIAAKTLVLTTSNVFAADGSALDIKEYDAGGTEQLILYEVSVAPEPTSLLLASGALLPLVARRRRRS